MPSDRPLGIDSFVAMTLLAWWTQRTDQELKHWLQIWLLIEAAVTDVLSTLNQYVGLFALFQSDFRPNAFLKSRSSLREATPGATLPTHPPPQKKMLFYCSTPLLAQVSFSSWWWVSRTYSPLKIVAHRSPASCSQRMKYWCENKELAFVFLLIVLNKQNTR